MKIKVKIQRHTLFKGWLYLVLGIGCLFAGYAFAQTGAAQDIPGIVGSLGTSLKALGNLMIAIAYLAGIGFVLASIFKFKQHKDNPTQIPLGTPLAMLVIGIVLIFLPMIFGPVGKSIFGTEPTAGGFRGEGLEKIPGGK